MTILEELDRDLKQALRGRDKGRVDCIRQVRSKLQEAMHDPSSSGRTDDDAFARRVITSYVKSLRKALVELEAAGERSRDLRGRYQAEIDYLARYLPEALDEAETRALVEKVVAELGARERKDLGKVMGRLMKDHKSSLDPSLARRIAEELLP